jgi:hypothetical protein
MNTNNITDCNSDNTHICFDCTVKRIDNRIIGFTAASEDTADHLSFDFAPVIFSTPANAKQWAAAHGISTGEPFALPYFVLREQLQNEKSQYFFEPDAAKAFLEAVEQDPRFNRALDITKSEFGTLIDLKHKIENDDYEDILQEIGEAFIGVVACKEETVVVVDGAALLFDSTEQAQEAMAAHDDLYFRSVNYAEYTDFSDECEILLQAGAYSRAKSVQHLEDQLFPDYGCDQE